VGQIARCISRCACFHLSQRSEKTKRAYNAKGWSTLGDVGYLDDEGFLYLTDRKSYMIIPRREHYPRKPRTADHPSCVADVAVFACRTRRWARVKAVCSRTTCASGQGTRSRTIVFCRKHLSRSNAPRVSTSRPNCRARPSANCKRRLR